MARLIDADVLVERWKRLASKSWNEAIVTSWSHAYEEIISEIEEEPTIEAEAVSHGEWIFDSFTAKFGNPYRCSRCNEEFHDAYNFCPNCGAKMK